MPRKLEIEIDVTNVTQATNSLRQLAQQVRQLQGSGGGAGTLTSGTSTTATAAVARAAARSAATAQDQQLRRLTNLLYSTRVNLGGASPLVGRTLQALGAPASGVEALAAGGMVAGVAGFAAAVKDATENLNNFGDAIRETGGTPADVAGMRRFGITAGGAGALRERIATDPYAMMAAARLGVHALPRPFGEVNEAGIANRLAEQLKGIADPSERLRTARMLGPEAVGALRYMDISPGLEATRNSLMEMEKQMGGGAKAANELAVATETLQQAWTDLASVALTPIINDLAYGMGKFAALFSGNWAEAFSDSPTARNTKALDANTQATEGVYTMWQELMRHPGGYGGGSATARVDTMGWKGESITRNAEIGALNTGTVNY